MGLREKIQEVISTELNLTKDDWQRCVNQPDKSDFAVEVDDLEIKCPVCKEHVDPVSVWLHDHDVMQVLGELKSVIAHKDWLSEYKKNKLIMACCYIIEFCSDNIERG